MKTAQASAKTKKTTRRSGSQGKGPTKGLATSGKANPAQKRKASKKKKTSATGRKSSGKSLPKLRLAGKPVSAGAIFKSLVKASGCASMVIVAERAGDTWDLATESSFTRTGLAEQQGGDEKGRSPTRPSKEADSLGDIDGLAVALAAMGHPQRLRILKALVEGPAVYQTLCRVTKCRPGPLYHHITQLRLAGLIAPKSRDLYQLTRAGRNLILVAMSLDLLISDRRARPDGF